MELTRNQVLLADSVNEVVKDNSSSTDDIQGLIEKVSRKFLNKKLDDFPSICDITFIQNKLKREELSQTAKRGKFDYMNKSETYWSDERNFMHDFEIPQELYCFMQTFVYKDFWTKENEKIWRPFMGKLCKSRMIAYDAMNMLIKIKQYYGSNMDLSLTE